MKKSISSLKDRLEISLSENSPVYSSLPGHYPVIDASMNLTYSSSNTFNTAATLGTL